MARNTGRRSIMKRFGQLLIWWNETSRPGPQSTVGSGHHLHPERLRIPLSGHCARCLQPPSRVGWTMKTHLRTQLVLDALEMAL